MMNRMRSYFGDVRNSERVDLNRTLSWQLAEQNKAGKGKILNISTTGMLLETADEIEPKNRAQFTFDTDLGPDNFVPRVGELVWQQKPAAGGKRLCGIRFVEPNEYIADKLKQKILRSKFQTSQREHWGKVATAVLPVLFFAIFAYVLFLSYEVFRNVNQSNQNMLAVGESQAAVHRQNLSHIRELNNELVVTRKLYLESEAMLETVSKELLTTKIILAQTERMLTEARNQAFIGPDGISTSRAQLEAKIATLEAKNAELTGEMARIESELAKYSGTIETEAQGREFIQFFKGKIQEVKGQVKNFRSRAHQVRREARSEQNRIRMLLGNHGFIIKDGLPVKIDEARFKSGILDYPQTPGVAPIPENVQVDVQFVD